MRSRTGAASPLALVALSLGFVLSIRDSDIDTPLTVSAWTVTPDSNPSGDTLSVYTYVPEMDADQSGMSIEGRYVPDMDSDQSGMVVMPNDGAVCAYGVHVPTVVARLGAYVGAPITVTAAAERLEFRASTSANSITYSETTPSFSASSVLSTGRTWQGVSACYFFLPDVGDEVVVSVVHDGRVYGLSQ